MNRAPLPTTWRAVAWLVGQLPWAALAMFGALVGALAGSVFRLRRAHVQSAMRAAGIARPRAEARAMYRALGRSAMEFLWLAARGCEATRHVVIDPASRGRWSDAVGLGRGVVIAASHTGNWDLAACAMAREIELLVVTKHLRAASLDAFWQTTRQGQGVALAPASGALSRSLRTLARGRAVAMMIDQVPGSKDHGVDVDFLGRRALADRAPAVLAARAGAPLLVAVSRRTAAGEHLLHVLAVLAPPLRPGRAWIEGATVAATGALDRFVRAHPSQWLWLHRRWKDAPEWATAGEGRATLAPSCATPPTNPRPSSLRGGASRAASSSAPASTRT